MLSRAFLQQSHCHIHIHNTEERYVTEKKEAGRRVCATTNLQGVLFFEIGVNYTENVFLMVFRRVEILDLVVEYIFCAVMTQKYHYFVIFSGVVKNWDFIKLFDH